MLFSRPSERIVLYFFLGLVGYGVILRSSRPSVENVIYERQASTVLKAGKAYRKQIEIEKREVARLRRLATAHTAKADTLYMEREAIPLPEITPAACAPFAERLSKCAEEASELRQALAADSAALDTASAAVTRATERADTLEVLLRARPKPCRILGVKCPVVGIGPTIGTDLHPDVRIGVFLPLF